MLRVACGSSASPTSTGVQTVDTGKDWRNKAIITCASFAEAIDTPKDRVSMSLGAWDGSTQYSMSLMAQQNQGTSNTNRGQNDGMIRTLSPTKSVQLDGDGTTLNTAGDFTINWLAVLSQAKLFSWMALGGDDLEEAKVSKFTSASPASTQRYDLGLSASAVFLFGSFISATIPTTSDNLVSGVAFLTKGQTLGFGIYSQDNQAASTAHRDQRTDAIIAPGGGADAWRGSAMLEGRTLEITWAVNTSEADFFVLALQGPQAKAVAITSPNATTGVTSFGGFGFVGRGLLAGSVGADHVTANQEDALLMLGKDDGATGIASTNTDEDEADPSVTKGTVDNDGPLTLRDIPSSHAITEQASVQRYSVDGPNLNFTTNTSNEREYLLMQLGDRFSNFRGRQSVRGRVSQEHLSLR